MLAMLSAERVNGSEVCELLGKNGLQHENKASIDQNYYLQSLPKSSFQKYSKSIWVGVSNNYQ